jgi:hypothetical protein
MIRFLLPKGAPGPYGRLIRVTLLIVELVVVFVVATIVTHAFVPAIRLFN